MWRADCCDERRTLCENSEGVIIRGSTDIASTSCCIDWVCRDLRDLRSLDVALELASSVTLIALFNFLRMKKVAIMMTSKKTEAPPMMPPSSGFVSPLLAIEVDVGDVFAMGVLVTGTADILETTPPTTATVVVGAPTMVSEVIVVMIVYTTELESVVFVVSVTVNVTGSVV